MRIEQLYYLAEIARTNSISKAAKNLFVTQPSISEAIRKLEKELGVSLLERTPNGIFLTKAGKKAVMLSKEIITKFRELEREISLIGSAGTYFANELTVLTSSYLCNTIMPYVIQEYYKKTPDICLSIIEKDFSRIIMGLAYKKADLGIISVLGEVLKGNKLENSGLIFEKMAEEKVYACVGKDSTLTRKSKISIKEIIENPVAVFTFAEHLELWMHRFSKNHGTPKVKLNTNNFYLVGEAVAKCQAIGFFTELFFRTDDSWGDKIVPLNIDEDIWLVIGWVRSKERHLTSEMKSFIDIFEEKYTINNKVKCIR